MTKLEDWFSLSTVTSKVLYKHLDKLFAIKWIKSSTEILNLLSSINRCLKGLHACGKETEGWSTILAYLVSEQLDETTYLDFQKFLTTNTSFSKWRSLKKFLENRVLITKHSSDSDNMKLDIDTTANHSTTLTVAVNSDNLKLKWKCCVCSQYHLLIDYKTFKSETPIKRAFYSRLNGHAVIVSNRIIVKTSVNDQLRVNVVGNLIILYCDLKIIQLPVMLILYRLTLRLRLPSIQRWLLPACL